MRRIISKVACDVPILEQSISSVLLSTTRSLAPISFKICRRVLTSDISGRFSILQTPSTMSAAGIIATAAFFAPLISTSPCSGFPPLMTYFVTGSPLTYGNNTNSLQFVTEFHLLYNSLWFFAIVLLTKSWGKLQLFYAKRRVFFSIKQLFYSALQTPDSSSNFGTLSSHPSGMM